MSSTSLQFSTSQVLSEAWKILKQKWVFLLGLWASIFGVSLVIEVIRVALTDEKGILTALSMLAAQVLSLLIGVGAMKVILKVVRNQQAEISEIFTAGVQHLWQYFILSLVTGLIVGFGFLLLIVPGIIWALKYMFAPYALVDDKLSFSEAMAVSDKLTQGIKWQLFGFGWVLILLNLVGLLAIGLGLIITIPVSTLAGYVLYTQLKAQLDAVSKPGETSSKSTIATTV